jgi:ferric-dicitrate binding protein FerR (iron transport regulator)
MPPKSEPSPARRPWWRRPAAWLVLLAVLMAAAAWWSWRSQNSFPGSIYDLH